MVCMDDNVDDEPALTPAELELKNRAIQRAHALAYALLEAPPGSFWDRRLHGRARVAVRACCTEVFRSCGMSFQTRSRMVSRPFGFHA